MKKLSVILLAMGLLILSACTGTSQSEPTTEVSAAPTEQKTEVVQDAEATPEEPVELSLWMSYASTERQQSVQDVVDAFEEKYPYVTVDITFLPDGGLDKAKSSFEAGEGPDVYRVGIDPEFIEAGYVRPLNEFVDAWDGKEKVVPAALDYAATYDVSGNGNLYYLPVGATVTTFWARTDWMEELNVSIDTWDNFFAAIETMTTDDHYGLSIRGGKGGTLFYEAMMYSYSGMTSLFDENGVCTINDPRHAEFIEKYLSAYNKYTAEGDINYGYQDIVTAFDSGMAGVIIHNLGSAGDHLTAFDGDLTKFGAFGMPLNAEGTSVNPMKADDGFMMSSACENPEMAWELIAAFATGDSLSEHCRQWGNIPMNTEVLATAEWLQEYPWYQSAVDLLLSETTLFYDGYVWFPNKKTILKEMEIYGQEVMAGELSAQEFLDIWAEKLQAEYDANVK